jgi:uncharacterized phage protein (TIGR02218 family)
MPSIRDISSSADLGVDNLEIIGVVDGLGGADLSAGVFNNAEVTVFRVDPLNLAAGEMIEKRGYIGEISIVDDKYVCEIVTSAAYTRRNVGLVTSPTCRVRRFCDNQCKLSLASFTHTGVNVGAVASPRDIQVQVTLDSALAVATSRFNYGLLRVNRSGRWFEREVKEISLVSGNTYLVFLREPFGFEIDDIDIELIQGCDRKLTTCISLSNAVNFRGEPHLPGTDTISKAGRAPE